MKTAVLVWMTIIGLMLYGWTHNIILLAHSHIVWAQLAGVQIIRVVGIFVAPLGAVMGYIGN